MGQYFVGVIQGADGRTAVKGYRQKDIGGLKLTEHSWWNNDYVNWFAREIYKDPHRIAWVGDYSEDALKEKGLTKLYEAAHGEKEWGRMERVSEREFTLKKTYLVNHTKKQYLDCDEYRNRSASKDDEGDWWTLHPLPLLTAIGNGEGGGDYFGVHREDVGCWCWDLLSVEDEPPAGYAEQKFVFIE